MPNTIDSANGQTRWGRIDENFGTWARRHYHILDESGNGLCGARGFIRIYVIENGAAPTAQRYRLCRECCNRAAFNAVAAVRREVNEMAATHTMSARTFGIEIECISPVTSHLVADAIRQAGVECHVEGYNHTTRAHWKIVTDGSVHGNRTHRYAMEIVSPPLSGNSGFDAIRAVCSALHRLNVTVNRSCGLHVHHDASGITGTQMFRAAGFYSAFEPVFDSFMPVSRRGDRNTYCRSLRRYNLSAYANRALTLDDVRRAYIGGERYLKVNLTAYWRHGTIEFRQHSGSVNAAKIIAWVQTTNAIMEWAMRGTTMVPANNDNSDAATRNEMFGMIGIPRNIAQFLTRRASENNI